MTANVASTALTKSQTSAELLGSYHRCWYPVALSAEVGPGQVMGRTFLGGRVVIYRTAAGRPFVKSAYCRHLGADLSLGTVSGDALRCPFHFWEYNEAGVCSRIPAGDTPPPAARLFSYPTTESLGIIWAFNGEQPTYPAPHFQIDERELLVDTFRNPLEMEVASPVVFLNAFDLQHFRVVHGLDIDIDIQDMRRVGDLLHYHARVVVPELGKVRQDRILWGTNTVTVEAERDGHPLLQMHALCPVHADLTHGFLVNATRIPGTPEEAPARAKAMADIRSYTLRLVNEDSGIFRTMRFRADCMTKSDRLLRYGIDYISGFARSDPSRMYIS